MYRNLVPFKVTQFRDAVEVLTHFLFKTCSLNPLNFILDGLLFYPRDLGSS